MGSKKGLYNEEYLVGSRVRIVSQDELAHFKDAWSKHNPLQEEQLQYGGRTTTVKEVSFYHGGDELYVLDGVPGVWHECCLAPTLDTDN